MAIFHLSGKIVSRGQGDSATAAAAYRSRSMVHDERTGETHDYSRMTNRALFTGIFVPKDAPEWAQDREKLWNAIEQSEKRKDAQLARDFVVALPHEFTDQQRQWLVTDFTREQFQRRGYAADVAIHEPHEQGDTRNHHAHILVSMRILGAEGFAAKKDRSLNSPDYLQGLRESWAYMVNRHLERHGIEARVDHRSFKDQGIDRTPGLHMGKDATAAERKGCRTERGERAEAIKTRNAERQQLRAEIRTIEREQQRYERPINAAQAQIFDARFASDGAKAFPAALAEKGMKLAQVQEADLALVNVNRPADWRPIEAGAYVAVNQRGNVYELTERNTGLTRADRTDWLKELDTPLAGVTETQATIATEREAQRQAWREERPAPARAEAPQAPPVKEIVRDIGDLGGRAAGMVGNTLGGIIRLAEPLLGFLADFFTGTPSYPPVPYREIPPALPARELTPAERIRQKARSMALETPSLDPPTEAIRRFSPLALSPEKEANIQRLLESQARARRRDNERDDGLER